MTEDSIQPPEPTEEVVSADEAPDKGSPMSLKHCAYELYLDARHGRHTSMVQWAMRGFPFSLVHFLICLDAFEGDIRYADENAYKKFKGQKIVSWESFERQRIARYKKLPPFLCTVTLLTVIAFMAQDAFEGWKYTDTVLVTSRITEHKEWYRILTSIFMHSGAGYLCVNILFMWVYGFFLENKYGSVLVGSIFTISALGGTLVRAVFTPYGGAVGISGGWFGLTGMAYVVLWKHWSLYWGLGRLLMIKRINSALNPIKKISAFFLAMEACHMVFLFSSHQPYINQSALLFGVGFSALFIVSKRNPQSIFFYSFIRGLQLRNVNFFDRFIRGLPQRNVNVPTSLFVTSLACFLKAIDFLWRSGNSELLCCPNCCRDDGSYQLATNGTAGLTHLEAGWNGRGTSDQSTSQLISLLHQIACFGYHLLERR